MWLGETEQHIAGMFAEAEAEGALLFLDEADSFLRDRALARAEWAVTQVNELLQRMERHPGIFIAATNLMADVDSAALRRFTWKLEFLALAPEQAWRMFCTEAAVATASSDPTHLEALAARLGAIENLTPGDFATVKRQANMLAQDLNPEEWLEQLDLEAKAKTLGLQRHKPGFA
jgi:transitional endoplasmic reticulum ATPase